MLRLATLLVWGLAALFLAGSAAKPDYRNRVTPACDYTSFEGAPFTLCRADPGRHDVRLIVNGADGRPLRTFAALRRAMGADAARVSFAMNAGMYDWDGNPIGLYVENGVERHAINLDDGKGNFHLKPNGVLWADARGWHVSESAAFAAVRPKDVRWATQSGPLLVADGRLHPKVTSDGPSRYTRNAVGIAPDGAPVFVISHTRISFGKIARLMRDQLGCRDVLFLDGYVSSLWDAASGRSDQHLNIGPMLVVSERQPTP